MPRNIGSKNKPNRKKIAKKLVAKILEKIDKNIDDMSTEEVFNELDLIRKLETDRDQLTIIKLI